MSSPNRVSLAYTDPYVDDSNGSEVALEDYLRDQDAEIAVFIDGTFEHEDGVNEWENFWNALTEEEQNQTLAEGNYVHWNGQKYEAPQRADQARKIQEHSEKVRQVYPGIIVNDHDIEDHMPDHLGSSNITQESKGVDRPTTPSLENNTPEELPEGYRRGLRVVGEMLAYDTKFADEIIDAANKNDYEEVLVIRDSISVIDKSLRDQDNDIKIDELNQPDLSSEDQKIVDFAATNFLV